MKKKLLAGIMALALCSTSIPQMIFAEEFTSGVLEETTPEETEEIPEVFTDENQAAAGDEIGGVSEFSSEEVPEFDDESDNAAVATDGGDTTATSPKATARFFFFCCSIFLLLSATVFFYFVISFSFCQFH